MPWGGAGTGFPAGPGGFAQTGQIVFVTPSNDATGVTDTANLTTMLSTFSCVVLTPGVFFVNQGPILIPGGQALLGAYRSLGIPAGNYGVSGLPLTGSIIKPVAAFTGGSVLQMQPASPGLQGGGQVIERITIDGTSLPAGTVHGIHSLGPVAGVTLRENLVYSVTGDGLRAESSSTYSFKPPDFWDVSNCKFSLNGGAGATLVGLSDSWILECESTANQAGDGWKLTDGTNSKFTACKSEGNHLFGFNLSATTAGEHHFIGCTTTLNTSGGFSVAGAGSKTYYFDFCAAFDTTPWTYAGTNNVKSPAAYNTSTAAPTLA